MSKAKIFIASDWKVEKFTQRFDVSIRLVSKLVYNVEDLAALLLFYLTLPLVTLFQTATRKKKQKRKSFFLHYYWCLI